MSKTLPYRVECMRQWWEVIAAFDCEPAAVAYAEQCREARWFAYRVVGKRGRLIREWPEREETS